MKLKACKKVCNQCPFKNNSIKGWLGSHTIQDIQLSLQFELLYSCHKQRTNNEELNKKLVEEGKHKICRGFLISASKSCKLFGQNPFTGSELKRLQNELEISKEENETILNKWEFQKHHTLPW